jgi:hypothetical protein
MFKEMPVILVDKVVDKKKKVSSFILKVSMQVNIMKKGFAQAGAFFPFPGRRGHCAPALARP